MGATFEELVLEHGRSSPFHVDKVGNKGQKTGNVGVRRNLM